MKGKRATEAGVRQTTWLSPAIFAKAQKLAVDRDWTISKTLARLIETGLEHFTR